MLIFIIRIAVEAKIANYNKFVSSGNYRSRYHEAYYQDQIIIFIPKINNIKCRISRWPALINFFTILVTMQK